MSDHEMEKSLISAYCDGELNAAEQARTEELLETSAAARGELQSYRQISNLLRDARPQVRADLTADVLGAIQSRESATGKSVAAKQEIRPVSTVKPDTRKRLWAAAAVSAACVIAMVWIGLNGAGNNQQIANNDNKQPAHVPEVVPAPNNLHTDPLVKPVDKQPVETVANVTPKNPGTTITPANNANNKVETKPLEANQLPVELIADLKNSDAGRTMRFIRQNEDGVTVFHLMVVDIKPGMESLEMILSAQQISPVDGKPVNDRGDVVAVYVEAKDKKMEALVHQLKAEHEKFLALAVQQQAMPNEQVASLKTKKTTGEQAISVDAGELKTVGVSPLQPQQIEMAAHNQRNGSSFKLPPKRMANGSAEKDPMYKLLIVVEKATLESLRNQPN